VRGGLRGTGLIAAVWALSLGLLYNLCDLLFRCGCTWAWSGGAHRCNVHHPQPPHCPWCSHGLAAFLWVPATLLLAETLVMWRMRRRRPLFRLLGGMAAFLLVGGAAGLMSALADGYPRFLWWTLR